MLPFALPYTEDTSYAYNPIVSTQLVTSSTLAAATSSNPNIYPTVNPCGVTVPSIPGEEGFIYGNDFVLANNVNPDCPNSGTMTTYDYLQTRFDAVN